MVRKVRGNGWRDKWFRMNDLPCRFDENVPLGWHLFEAHMGGSRKADRDLEQKTSYKDRLFQHLAKADKPENACWAAVFMYFREAVKQIVNEEVTAITFPESRNERGTYVPYDESDKSPAYSARTQGEVAEVERIGSQDDIPTEMGFLVSHEDEDEDEDEDLKRRVSGDLVTHVFQGLSSREKLIVYFLLHKVTLNRIPLDNPVVQSAAGTHRFQALYDDVKKLSAKLLTVAHSCLKTDYMRDANVNPDPYETLLLRKMLRRALMPKINAWAEAENLPQPPF